VFSRALDLDEGLDGLDEARSSTWHCSVEKADTLSASGTSSASAEAFVAEELSLIQSPDAPISREISGL
jgi:uncharacterized protein YoaH (UPF0181 family)